VQRRIQQEHELAFAAVVDQQQQEISAEMSTPRRGLGLHIGSHQPLVFKRWVSKPNLI